MAFHFIPTGDVLLVFFFLVSGFFYGLLFGRSRMLALTISIYVGIACVSTFPIGLFTTEKDAAVYIPIGVFAVSTFATHLIFYASLLSARRLGNETWWQVFIISFVSIGLIVSTSMRLLPGNVLTFFTDTTQSFFLSDTAFMVWFLLPLLALMLVSRKL